MVKKSYMGMRVRVTQSAPNMVAGKPDILPGLRPIPSLTIISPDNGAQHPQFVTLPYINNNPISCFYKYCVTQIGTEAVWTDEDLMCGNTMHKLHVMTKEEEKIRDSNNKISCITKSEWFTAPYIPAAFALVTGATINTPYHEFQFIYNYLLQIINSVSCSCLSFLLHIMESHKHILNNINVQ